MKAYKEIVESFIPRNFYPLRGLFSFWANEHVQTIIGSEALKVKVIGEVQRPFEATTERFQTSDGDFFDVDYTTNFNDDFCKGIVIILHGLESNIKGPLVTRMATAFYRLGFACCMVSFRGCNGEDNNRPGGYHLGFTDDIHFFSKVIHERYSHLPIYLAGFSLGGSVTLKFLSELGDEARKRNIRGAIVTSVPFDAVASQGKIDRGLNRILYSTAFLLTLKQKAERQIKQFPGAFDINLIRQSKTIGEFDDYFVAPIYNFSDKVDYYTKSSSIFKLKNIKVPTIAINARDDPFIEENSLPTHEDHVQDAPVRLIYHDYGGHCGFLAHEDSFKLPGVDQGSVEVPSHGWLADEMGRALQHIHENVMLESMW